MTCTGGVSPLPCLGTTSCFLGVVAVGKKCRSAVPARLLRPKSDQCVKVKVQCVKVMDQGEKVKEQGGKVKDQGVKVKDQDVKVKVQDVKVKVQDAREKVPWVRHVLPVMAVKMIVSVQVMCEG